MVLIYKFLQTPFTKKNPMKILLILSITIIDLMKSSIISLTLANRKAYLMFQYEDLLRFFVINNLFEYSACFYITDMPCPLGQGC